MGQVCDVRFDVRDTGLLGFATKPFYAPSGFTCSSSKGTSSTGQAMTALRTMTLKASKMMHQPVARKQPALRSRSCQGQMTSSAQMISTRAAC